MSVVSTVGSLASTTTLREFADQSSRQPERASQSTVGDKVEISELAKFLSRLAELPEDRARKIVDVRNAITDGTYLTPEKIDIATERLLKDI